MSAAACRVARRGLTRTEGGGEGTWTKLKPAASISFRMGAAGHQSYGMFSPSLEAGSVAAMFRRYDGSSLIP
ncbi:MAG: hypothetical protein WA696_14490 [Solirubrobacterales bacterium]